jgi:hypothetical protein
MKTVLVDPPKGPFCFRCGPRKATKERDVCVARGHHLPQGDPIQHHEQVVRLCWTCDTLVVG